MESLTVAGVVEELVRQLHQSVSVVCDTLALKAEGEWPFPPPCVKSLSINSFLAWNVATPKFRVCCKPLVRFFMFNGA